MLPILLVAAIGCCLPVAAAGEEPILREIFVPFEDLNVVLEGIGRRVFLTRSEFKTLREKARRAPENAAPQATALLSAEYDAVVTDGRALVSGKLLIEVAADGLRAIPLPLGKVGLRRATLDGQPAALHRQGDRATLFVAGRGRHELLLDMVLPVEVSAARQTVRYTLPHAATGRVRLTVPGNIEVKSGAQVLRRTLDKAANVTRFELLPTRGDTALVMTLNNRLAQRQLVVVARNVMVHELTETYERLHVTAAMKVVHGATQQFRFAVPAGFEITKVAAPVLQRWEVIREEGGRVLTVRLRSQESENVVLNITAQRTPAVLQGWRMPEFRPLDVAGSVSVVGLLLEQRLRLTTLEAEGAIPLDTQTLTDTLPASLLAAEPGAPTIRAVAAYYVPQATFDLAASFDKPAGRIDVTGNILLIVQDAGLQVRGGFALSPVAEKISGCDFTVEPGWRVDEVTHEGQPLTFEQYQQQDGTPRINLRLPRGVPPGEVCSIHFHATHTPNGWLDAWQQQQVRFPQFVVTEATGDRGAVAVQVLDDLVARPARTSGLTPLDDNRKAEFNLADVPTNLAFRYDSRPFTATLDLQRTSPRITAETYSFLKIEANNLRAHYELIYDVTEARTRELKFVLPASTPRELTIVGLQGVAIKEFTSDDVDPDLRAWRVQLARPTRGIIRIAVSFQQRLEMAPTQTVEGGRQLIAGLQLPVVAATAVQYQTGMVAVEGSPELEITLNTEARKVDVGELVDAQYQPGQRLLGAFGFVGQPPALDASVTRPAGYGLPAAIVERGELVTAVSAEGISQTAARFLLRTKAQFLEIELPDESTFWSAFLDRRPAKPQRDQQRLLISLPATDDAQLRDLQLVYETPVSRLGLWGSVAVSGPKLFLRDLDQQDPVQVPLADLTWHVYLPAGYRLADSDGTVYPDLQDRATRDQLARGRTPLENVAGILASSPVLEALNNARAVATTAEPQSRKLTERPFARQSRAHRQGAADGVDKRTAAGQFSPQPDAEERAADEVSEITIVPSSRAPSTSAASQTERLHRGVRKLKGAAPPPTGGRPTSVAAAARPSGRAKGARPFALRGLRSLKIDLTRQGDKTAFASLGAEPRLDVTLVDGRRITLLAWAVALAVLTAGLFLLRRSVRARLQFVAAVLIMATVLPLVLGWNRELGMTLDFAFYAALALLPVYLMVGSCRWIASLCGRPTVATAAVVLVVASLCSTGRAAEPQTIQTDALGPLTVQIVEPDRPVRVPADAVIVPYHPDDAVSPLTAPKVIVPYQKYVELWNAAYPDQKIDDDARPADYSFAGARWKVTLEDGEFLQVAGQIDLDVFADKLVRIPLAIDDAVLVRAELDGEPARIELAQPATGSESIQPPSNQPQGGRRQVPAQQRRAQPNPVEQTAAHQVESAAANATPRPDTLTTLYALGKGRRQLALTIRYRLTRRGGWRVVRGRLPAQGAAALALTVPQPQTELRLAGVSDRTTLATSQPDARIDTALAPGGRFRIEWRPKVAQATVDRSLTAESDMVLDVQEDSIRLTWQLNLKFPLSERDFFTIGVPRNYLVEQVSGENVRGWEIAEGQLRVTLLKAARDAQQLTLQLARRGTVGGDDLMQFDAPLVEITDSLLHEGRLAIRRSPQLELRVTHTDGLTRTDLAAVRGVDQDAVESPLGIRPFQAFRFSRTPFTLGLSATPVATRLTAEIQCVLRLAERERTLESRVALRGEGRAIFAVELDLPAALEVDEVVAPGQFQWYAEPVETGQLLRIYLAKGQLGDFAVIVRGPLGQRGQVASVALPKTAVRGAVRQQTTIVVQTDPSFTARLEDLDGCQPVLLQQAHGWLAAEQRELARLAVHCPTTEFSGQVVLKRRTAQIACQTVSNLRITTRTFEETILLDFSIEEAGLRQLSFLLPAALRDARITAAMLRQKTVEDVPDTGQVRVRLELQDEVMGQFRVLIENDRLLTNALQVVPIPTVETGLTSQQFVALESAGRDELLVDQLQGLEPLSREQQQWRILTAMLGERITQAYLVRAGEPVPRLAVKTRDREAVDTVGARIAFARTVLTVDTAGAYRGLQTYQVDNRTEQFLEVRLPAGATLWTARVAGEPVKPIVGRGVIRIPLVKTAAGDQDYPVELKYGGSRHQLGRWSTVDFPLILTKNINVEESQVRLWLPPTHRWFRFSGSMRLAENEDDLTAHYLKYKTKQLRLATANLANANPFAQLRARNNLRKLTSELDPYHYRPASPTNEQLQLELSANTKALEEASQSLVEFERREKKADVVSGNRDQMNRFFAQQSNSVSRNIVTAQDSNFDRSLADQSGGATETDADRDESAQITSEWFDKSGLSNKLNVQSGERPQRWRLETPSAQPQTKTPERRAGRRAGPAPKVAAGAVIDDLKRQKAELEQQRSTVRGERYGEKDKKLRRFKQRLQMQQQTDALQTGIPGSMRASEDSSAVPGRRRGRSLDSAREREVQVRNGPEPAITPAAPADTAGAGTAGRAPPSAAQPSQIATTPPEATGLASLDVQLPTRGVEYLFTTPGGDIEIAARAIEQPLLSRLIRLACVLIGITAVVFIYRRLRHINFDGFANRGVCLLLILIGFCWLLTGLVPVLALATIVVGGGQLTRLTLIKWFVPATVHGPY